MQQQLAMLRAMSPQVAEWGTAAGLEHIGFEQYFIAPDGSGVRLIVALPKEMKATLTTGASYPLGGYSQVGGSARPSQEGWSGKCPDDEHPVPTLAIEHYGRPAPDAQRLPFAPSGDLGQGLQTHTLRMHRDNARLTLTTVDLAHRWIEGVASGEASWIEARISQEKTGRGMSAEEMCNPANYIVHTEPFELKFAVHIDHRWAP
jgi:hypothetical protein